MSMTLNKREAESPTTYLTVRQKGEQSGTRTITIYNATPAQVLTEFQEFIACRGQVQSGTQPITSNDARSSGMTTAVA